MTSTKLISVLLCFCLTLMGCATDSQDASKAKAGDDEIQSLAAVQQIDKLVEPSKSTTAGLQIVTIENLSNKAIFVSSYHNGCDVDAVEGLCNSQYVLPMGSMTYAPDAWPRSYDTIVQVFTYMAEAIQLVVSIALAVVTGGAGSALIAEGAAEIAGTTAEVAIDTGVEASIATTEGAEAAGTTAGTATENALNVSAESSGGAQGFRIGASTKAAINLAVSAPLQTVKGGLDGGYMHGLSGAMSGLLQAVENAAIGAALEPKAVKAMAGALGASGALTASNTLQAMGQFEEWTFGKLGKASSKFWGLFQQAPADSAKIGAVTKGLATGVSRSDDKKSFLLETLKELFFKGSAKVPHYYQLVQKDLQKGQKVNAADGLAVLQYTEGDDRVGAAGTSTQIPINGDHIRTIVAKMQADPKGAAELNALTSDFVDKNVSLDRHIQGLAVAHNLYVHAQSIRSQLTPLFGSEAKLENFYDKHLPPQLLAAAKKLNTYYHLALSAENHQLYAKLNPTLVALAPTKAILEELQERDISKQGFAISAKTLKTYGYAPVAKLNKLDRQQVQNLLMFSRMAVGMPMPIQLWSNKEWTYTVDYNGKLYRNMAGFFLNHATKTPSYDYWYAPWYPPEHSKHNKYWQEVVGYTNRLGSFVSGKTKWDLTGLHPYSQHLYVDDNHQLEMHVEPLADKDWSKSLADLAAIWGSTKESVVMFTFSRDESINWWKGLKVSYPAVQPYSGIPVGANGNTSVEIGETGAPQSFFIPLGQLAAYVKAGAYQRELLLTTFEFQAAGAAGVHYPVGGALYELLDLAGKHVHINWVHDGGRDSDFYDVPNTYDLNGDEINRVESTQSPRTDGSTAITFSIASGINAWKGIAVQFQNGTKSWLGTSNSVVNAPGGIWSDNPVAQWGEYVHVELWSAGITGIHNYQKRIKVKTSSLVGQTTNFTWLSDGTNYVPVQAGYVTDGGHDKISVETSPLAPGNEDKALIVFNQGPGITWWKALQVRVKNNFKFISAAQDGVTSNQFFWLTQPLLPDGSQQVAVEFWKAKFLGIHTYVGEAKITWDSIKGKEVVFTWEND